MNRVLIEDPVARVPIVKAALAEAGYPDVRVIVGVHSIERVAHVQIMDSSLPVLVVWRALWLSGSPLLCCWPCYEHARSFIGDASLGGVRQRVEKATAVRRACVAAGHPVEWA